MTAMPLHNDITEAPVHAARHPGIQSQVAPLLRRVTYVVSLFPSWSETFIVREINALIEQGVDVRIVSLKRPRDMLLQTDAAALMDRVDLPGALPQETNRALPQQTSIFALPSQIAADGGREGRDGIPVALMEAMASGPAVVSCLTSGIPELITDGEHGLLVPERDPAALAGALQTLLGDDGLHQRLSVAARRRVELQFDARQEARKLHALMSTALSHVT